jgi:hypothetical protein
MVNEDSDAGRHVCPVDEHGVEDFLVTGVERFEGGPISPPQWHLFQQKGL